MASFQIGNLVLIAMGVALIGSGPVIIFRTATGVIHRRKADPKASLQILSNLVNVAIAITASVVGVLFVVNNLRGSPLVP